MVIRAEFAYRDAMLQLHPTTFSVPRRFAKHMMVVVDLGVADAGAVDDAVGAAWELQRRAE